MKKLLILAVLGLAACGGSKAVNAASAPATTTPPKTLIACPNFQHHQNRDDLSTPCVPDEPTTTVVISGGKVIEPCPAGQKSLAGVCVPDTTTTTVPPTTTTTTPPVPPVTAAEAAAALHDPALTFFKAPRVKQNLATLNQAAAELLGAGRPIAHVSIAKDTGGYNIWLDEDIVKWLADPEMTVNNPNGLWPVLNKIDEMRSLWPDLPPTISGGSYDVQAGEVQPGTYVGYDEDSCYWELRDANGNITANNFINAAAQARVTIPASADTFTTDGCSMWIKVG